MAGWQIFLIAFLLVVLVWGVVWALLSATGRPSGPSVEEIADRVNRERGDN